jgi:hypothetical protein
MFYSTNLGGIAGADSKCQAECGAGWKAMLVGGTRRATVTPYVGDEQLDWVIAKYTHHYNVHDQLIWRTDEIPAGRHRRAAMAVSLRTTSPQGRASCAERARSCCVFSNRLRVYCTQTAIGSNLFIAVKCSSAMGSWRRASGL